MTITLNLDPEREARLRRRAAQSGQDVADYLLSLAENAPEDAAQTPLPRLVNTPLPQGAPEWKERLRNMAIINDPNAVLSLEATSRESIYEDDLR